jgi:hypothetical protein
VPWLPVWPGGAALRLGWYARVQGPPQAQQDQAGQHQQHAEQGVAEGRTCGQQSQPDRV